MSGRIMSYLVMSSGRWALGTGGQKLESDSDDNQAFSQQSATSNVCEPESTVGVICNLECDDRRAA